MLMCVVIVLGLHHRRHHPAVNVLKTVCSTLLDHTVNIDSEPESSKTMVLSQHSGQLYHIATIIIGR